MKKLLLATIAFSGLAISGPSLAADLRAPVYKAPPPVAAPWSWTGFYGGLNGGYAFGVDKTYDILEFNGTSFVPATSALPGTYNTQGGLAGGQIGANYQAGSLVFGLEADIDWSHIQGSYVDDPSAPPSGQSVITGTVEWFGTVRGRFGIAQDRWLAFATGGLAYGGVQGGVSNYTGASSPYLTDRHTFVGWTAGGGLEYVVSGNWSLKAEYLYVDLGEKEFSISDPTNLCGCTNASVGYVVSKSNNTVEFSVIRVGINYKFDWGSPVVARY
jgi:outer membrane immunogenic protein